VASAPKYASLGMGTTGFFTVANNGDKADNSSLVLGMLLYGSFAFIRWFDNLLAQRFKISFNFLIS
jgi:hypothetical protein